LSTTHRITHCCGHHLSHLRLPALTKKVARPTAPSYHRRPQIDGPTSHCVSRPVRLVTTNTTLPRWAQCYRTQCTSEYILWRYGMISYQQSNPSLISPSWLGLDFLKPSERTSKPENRTEPVTRNLLPPCYKVRCCTLTGLLE